MEHIKDTIKGIKISIPLSGEEVLKIREVQRLVKEEHGLDLSYRKLLMYLINKEIKSS